MNNEKNYWGIDIVEEILNPNQEIKIEEDLSKEFENWSHIETDKAQIDLYYQFLVSTKRVIEDEDFSIIELNKNTSDYKKIELCR
jgi:hypothetical protein